MISFVVVPLQAYLGVIQSEQFKQNFGPKLGGTTITHTIYTISILLTILDKSWSITFLTQVIEAIRDLSLASDVMVVGIVLISFVLLQQ